LVGERAGAAQACSRRAEGVVTARIDYDRAAASYDRGRAHRLAVFAEWRQRLGEYLPLQGTGPVLDLGAGTGIWADALTQWFGLPVLALEPAAQMRAKAKAKALPPGVAIVAGDGQAIPLGDHSCRAAWLSTVIHHIADLSTCAAEMGRVLKGRAPVLIRSSFPGRQDEIPLYRYFPGARRVAETFPTVEQTLAAFAASGFSLAALQRVHEPGEGDIAAWVERVRAMRHADATLAPLNDAEFAAGLAALEAAAASGEPVPPTGLDLMVLRARSPRP
jgi:ubiquinone/menaquinone biosynthesis C-methylase UbiE